MLCIIETYPHTDHALTRGYQAIVDAEWDILYSKLQALVDAGVKVVLSKLPIGDVATQFFADRYVWVLYYLHALVY